MSDAGRLTTVRTQEIPGALSDVAGAPGELGFVPLARMRIDPAFQRPVAAGGRRSIIKIARGFDWYKFTPVICAELPAGTLSIIDGQHRAIAAASRGFDTVPAYVLDCPPEVAAAAFAAINADVVKVSALDLHRARLTARLPAAVELQRVCDCAGVKLVARHRQDLYKVGESRSVAVLERALVGYGANLLILILQCITETSNGNPGLILGATVNGIGRFLEKKKRLHDEPSHLFDFFDTFDLAFEYEQARAEAGRTSQSTQFILTRQMNAGLKAWLVDKGALPKKGTRK